MQSTIEEGDLVVSTKILGHISEGLYRGPAGVFKELVSNAFDANARTVWISTGRPSFDVVSVRDDGNGMTFSKFKDVVSGGIGDSDKRSRPVQLINRRQMIGRLGIGILAVSQISHEFSIVSHDRASETAFRAYVRMKDFRKEVLDQVNRSMFESAEDEDPQTPAFPIGNYKVEEIPFEPRRAGLTITATEPTEGFRRQLSEDNPDPLPASFLEFIRWCGGPRNLDTGSWYKRMVWQLATLVPVAYLSDSNVCEGDEAMTTVSNTLRDFDFSVIIDGVKLFKPVELDGPTTLVRIGVTSEGDGPFHFPIEFDSEVWGARVRARGYIHGSAGSALHPTDLRGILIRLKNVGVGEYDKSFLGYRFTEGPRFAWLTGEVFVEQGLEDALTIGRDGFDIGHPHFIALRTWLHDELRMRVFPALHKGMAVRRERKEVDRADTRLSEFLELISSFAGKSVQIEHVADSTAPPVRVDLNAGVVKLNERASWPRGKRQRELAQSLSVIFELARCVDSGQEPVAEFIKLTRNLLSQ